MEPCVLALHRGSAGPALAPLPMKRCFFFLHALTSAFFILFSYVSHRLVVVVVLCFAIMEELVFYDVEADSKKQKCGCLVFACLSTYSLAALFVLFASSCFRTE